MLFFVAGLAVSSPGLHGASSPDEPIHLTATLVPPNDVTLAWKDPAPDAAGHIVEFTSGTNPEFITLGFLPPGQTTFTHPRLAPTTTYFYRVKPIYGPASNSVTVTLPKELSDADYTAKYALPEDYSWAGPKTIPPKTEVAMHSIRDAKTADLGAPTDLKASLVKTTVSAFHFTWTDHASDADGYVLETIPEGTSDFTVCAVMDPHINSFGFAFNPPVRTGRFRVRAFYYGQPSNVAEQKTGTVTGYDNLGSTKAAEPSTKGSH
ncbi:MAG TPA: fibronectin type III domain-containing protein [Opitutaceae bacterium]|nr:fibronectin type III domain-containing protein [Opitutaceae bacterium]